MTQKIKIVFLGLQHPHIWSRFKYVQERLDQFEIVGIFDEDEVQTKRVLEKLEVSNIREYKTVKELLSAGADVCLIHALDHDVPRLAIEALPYDFKALFLEKPGAALPEDYYKMEEEITTKAPDLIVEYGWEMHYSDVMNFARDVLAKGALGTITGAHFHGGCPSGAGFEKWQTLDSTLGGYLYTDGSHTIEQLVDLFGQPKKIISSVRVLPESDETFKAVVVYEDFFEKPRFDEVPVRVGTMKTTNGIPREDIGSIICEYEDKNVTLDFTGWEANRWCQDWTMDIYGTNGTFHSFLDPPVAKMYLREARAGYKAGNTDLTNVTITGEKCTSGHSQSCFVTQMDVFFQRVLLGKRESEAKKLEKCGFEIQTPLMRVLDAVFASAKERTFVDV